MAIVNTNYIVFDYDLPPCIFCRQNTANNKITAHILFGFETQISASAYRLNKQGTSIHIHDSEPVQQGQRKICLLHFITIYTFTLTSD